MRWVRWKLSGLAGVMRGATVAILAGLALGSLVDSGAGAPVRGPTPLSPNLVSLQATTMPEDHFKSIMAQSRVDFAFWPNGLWADPRGGWVPIKLNVEKKPFWEATRELCRAAGLTTNFGEARADRVRIWRVRDGSEFDGPFAAQGPFLIVANQIKRSASKTFATLEGRAFIDPATNVYACSQGIDVAAAADEKNAPVTQFSVPRFAPAARPMSPMILSLITPLNIPAEVGGKVSVKGSVRFLVATGGETVVIPELLRAGAVTKTLAGLSIDVKPITKVGGGTGGGMDDRLQVSVTIRRGTYPKELWDGMARNRTCFIQLAVADSDDRTLAAPNVLPPDPAEAPASANTMPDANTIEYRYDFPLAAIGAADNNRFEPNRLIINAATGVQEVKVPLDLADIPVEARPN